MNAVILAGGLGTRLSEEASLKPKPMMEVGDKTFLLSENESTYIPIGVVHALGNPGKVPLEIIEIQSGSYLGEDDIVRFDDRYGRHTGKNDDNASEVML
jgi:hypothetical protein